MHRKRSLLFFSLVFILLAISVVSAYSGTITITKTSGGKIIIGDVAPVPTHYCGNEILETYIGEQCDGVVYTGCSGIDANWVGELGCTIDCLYDASGCSVAPGGYCGDGACNNGETCSTCTNDVEVV